MGQDPRIFSDPWTWCKRGKCCKMPTEKECLCCKDVEWVRYFDLHGNYGLAVENIVSENKVNNAYDANTLKRWL